MRSFYPYVPNEVKHRKRTSREQLKVLENMFKQETKPSATSRKALSAQLGMTPREVQVWFQNRYVKASLLLFRCYAIYAGACMLTLYALPQPREGEE
ncbi:hypothetical protein FOMPIDRAFT_1128018 [Fomitopsis schrenkii]|uniref:Homeobox domain-containing protein n=1 Tax=Fomitopsis schrenkii TaxID=2126942 RepID=S8FGU5_FOMSC|nr:hypothetical protein FOMPIDRAFT_1128018 [Fomitopsis schrenkii]